MNAPRTTEYDYIDFLIATPYSYSCVEAARVQPEAADKPAHDSITRLLHRLEPSADELWREAEGQVEKQSGMLILDDSTLDCQTRDRMSPISRLEMSPNQRLNCPLLVEGR
jgi:putative transposase